jgi:NADPH-dependent 2,4-dienoyl-CoA reductase/sulfur reductase-like enzyme
MPNYNYLIVGGGMTADAAISGIREVDPKGSIGIFCAESHPPYNRPPLSKGLWKGKPLETIFRTSAKENAELHLGTAIESIDPSNKVAVADKGQSHNYEKLLLATGGSPRELPFGTNEIIYYRNLDDFHKLNSLMEKNARFAVIGGGFIGSELASALRDQGQDVVMLFPEEGIGSLIFPSDLATYLNDYYRQKGVEVLAGELVNGLEKQGEQISLKTNSGREVLVDQVIAGIGIVPNTSLAEAADIEVANGIVVNEFMQTNRADIFAAGDVANVYNPVLGMRVRVEHEDNALSGGKAAGRNMAGDSSPYDHLSYFYSDLFELGYEAVGELNPKLEIFADWQDPYQKGVVYYLDQGHMRGVLLWNVWDQVDSARKLISEPGPYSSEQLQGRLPE